MIRNRFEFFFLPKSTHATWNESELLTFDDWQQMEIIVLCYMSQMQVSCGINEHLCAEN